jgi:four helix bundle protein
MGQKAHSHRDLQVYQLAFKTAMHIFELSKHFPKEERYSLTDQIRRESRSICANIAEAWRRRRYEAVFVHKLNEVEGETAETQVWIEFAVHCDYMEKVVARQLYATYEDIMGKLVGMIHHSHTWTLPSPKRKPRQRPVTPSPRHPVTPSGTEDRHGRKGYQASP